MTKESNTRAGVRDAWDFYLSQHDISTPVLIQLAVTEAVTDWLNLHAEAIVRQAVTDAVSAALPSAEPSNQDRSATESTGDTP